MLPDALERKYPNAAMEWAWQFVFPEIGRVQQTYSCEMPPGVARSARRAASWFDPSAPCATEGDLMSIEIQILHAQLQTFLQAQARSVEQHRDDPHRAFQVRQHHSHFLSTQDDWQTNRLLRPDHVLEVTDRNVKHVLVQEQQRRECLVLG